MLTRAQPRKQGRPNPKKGKKLKTKQKRKDKNRKSKREKARKPVLVPSESFNLEEDELLGVQSEISEEIVTTRKRKKR